MLRRHAALLGYQPDFSILDRDDAEELLQACRGEMDIDLTATRFPKADVLADIFSLAVNKEKPVAAIARRNNSITSPRSLRKSPPCSRATPPAKKRPTPWTSTICWRSGSDCCGNIAEVREEHQRRFQFILVDEYQDTNKLQGDAD